MPRTNKHSSEWWLKLILRFNGYLSLPAFIAVIMPHSWLAWCVSYVEPETPVGLLVSYLARGLSGLVVFQGAMLLVFATDVRRYRTPIRVAMAHRPVHPGVNGGHRRATLGPNQGSVVRMVHGRRRHLCPDHRRECPDPAKSDRRRGSSAATAKPMNREKFIDRHHGNPIRCCQVRGFVCAMESEQLLDRHPRRVCQVLILYARKPPPLCPLSV